jgi:putative tricarboxylic transport membrane protein
MHTPAFGLVARPAQNLETHNMQRSAFLRTCAALGLAAGLPLAARAAAGMKMMIPANPAGGYDLSGRAIGKAMVDSGGASSMTYENKGGAAGAIGLAQFVSSSKGDPTGLISMGSVMLGGLITSKSTVSLDQATPLARLTTEYNVFVVLPDSPFKSMKDVVAALKKDPAHVKWGGGSRGSSEHLTAAMVAKAVGADAAKINYVAFRGGGEAASAILGGNVSVGGGGYSELAEYITAGKVRAIAVTSAQRLPGSSVPTLKEQGIDVETSIWRGIYGAGGISTAQRDELVRLVVKATQHASWADALKKNDWTPALLTGDDFGKFVHTEFSSMRGIMASTGMI